MNRLAARVPRRYRRPEILTGVIIVAALAIVEVGTTTGVINSLIMRPPTVIFSELLTSLGTQDVQADLIATVERVAITFMICIVVGSALSIVFWRYDLIRRAYIPFLGAVFGTPLVLLYLVFVVIFGRGTAAIVAISIPLGVIPIVINGTDALANVEQVYVRTARSFNATRRQLLWKVIIPDAAPDIFSGIRIGFSYIVITVTAVEFLLVLDKGLGGMVAHAYFTFKTTQMFVGITLMVLIAIVAIFILRRIESAIQQ